MDLLVINDLCLTAHNAQTSKNLDDSVLKLDPDASTTFPLKPQSSFSECLRLLPSQSALPNSFWMLCEQFEPKSLGIGPVCNVFCQPCFGPFASARFSNRFGSFTASKRISFKLPGKGQNEQRKHQAMSAENVRKHKKM